MAIKIQGTTIVDDNQGLTITGVSTFTNGPVLIGGGTSTGTVDQVLQVAGINSSAYIGGNLGIGVTNPLNPIQIGAAGTTVVLVNSSGFVGIGTTNAIRSLTVTGTGATISQLTVSGVSTFTGITTNLSTLFANQFSVSGLSTFNGITTVSGPTLFTRQFSASGVSTFTGITTNLSTLFANQFSVVGPSTFVGITTNLSTLFANQFSASGLSTFNGITTSTSTLFANQFSVSGVSTLGSLRVASGVVTAVSGVITYYGDGSPLVDVITDGYNTGINTSVFATLTGLGDNIIILPSTAGREYIIYSINAANVAVGNTEVNVIGAFDINSTGDRSYFAYNIPIPTGTAVELLKQPQVLNPSDKIVMRSTNYDRVGEDNIVQVHISYREVTSTKLFGVGLGTVGLSTSDTTTVYTATSPSVVQSIRLVNRTDTGAYPISVRILSGVTTINLVDNLIVPKYASVEILDNQKRLNTNEVLSVQVDQLSTIDVQVSGKMI